MAPYRTYKFPYYDLAMIGVESYMAQSMIGLESYMVQSMIGLESYMVQSMISLESHAFKIDKYTFEIDKLQYISSSWTIFIQD